MVEDSCLSPSLARALSPYLARALSPSLSIEFDLNALSVYFNDIIV